MQGLVRLAVTMRFYDFMGIRISLYGVLPLAPE